MYHERKIKLIKFKTTYKRPHMDDKDYNNYFTERYNHNLTMQAEIDNVQTVYTSKDYKHQNPLVMIELINVRNAEDGEFIRNYIQGYPVPDERQLYFDGEIKEGDFVEFKSKVTVIEKTASAEYKSSDFVKNHLPKVMPFVKGDGKYTKIDKSEVKPIVEGVLSNYASPIAK